MADEGSQPDTPPDAEADAPSGGTSDAAPDAKSDAVPDPRSDAVPDPKARTGSGAKPDAGRQAPPRPRPASAARFRPPSRRLTTRTAILAAVICALVLSLAYPLKQYLAQRSSIIQLREDNAARQAEVNQLKQKQRELNDPAYIKAQARQRLQYVMPGETAFVVVHQGETPKSKPHQDQSRVDRTSPWYSQLWQSARTADRAP